MGKQVRGLGLRARQLNPRQTETGAQVQQGEGEKGAGIQME